jgi:tetratricopeptide (TPR) repeat protein
MRPFRKTCEVAWDFARAGRYDLAKRQLRDAVGECPTCGQARAKLAFCLLRLGRRQEALAEAEEGVRLDPNRGFCHWALAVIQLEMGSLEAAEASVREAIRFDPTEAYDRFLLAQVHEARGNSRAALDAAEQGLAIDPLSVRGGLMRAQFLNCLGQGALARDPAWMRWGSGHRSRSGRYRAHPDAAGKTRSRSRSWASGACWRSLPDSHPRRRIQNGFEGAMSQAFRCRNVASPPSANRTTPRLSLRAG